MTDEVRTRRIARDTWNAACVAAAGHADRLTLRQWAALTDAGLADGPDEFSAEWAGLIADYLDAPAALRLVASHGDTVVDAAIAVGAGSICVRERLETSVAEDGSRTPVRRDDLLEVSVTTGHPWALVRRVLPALATLQAPARQTSSRTAVPVTLDEETRERITAALASDPDADPTALLRACAPGPVATLVSGDTAQVAYTLTERRPAGATLTGVAWYLASEQELFRATFTPDPPFEQVRPGDLAFTFQWHLMGALGTLTTR